MAEHKILGIILFVGLLIVAGIFWVIDEEEQASLNDGGETVAVAPPDDAAAPAGDQAARPEIVGEPLDETMAGKVLVSNRPVQVRAEPSESASAMFGFPAGRPFRAISRKDGYIRIQDVRSGASGWIEEAALAPAPTAPPPVAATPSGSSRSATSTDSRPSRSRSSQSETAAAPPQPAPEPQRRGLFGGGGILGGLFGGGR